MTVNGKWFTVLTGAETIDVGPAMVEGSDNTVALWGWGAEGTVMLSDVVPSQDSGSVGWTLPLWAVPLWHGYNSSLPW